MGKNLTPTKAARKQCLGCCGEEQAEVRRCSGKMMDGSMCQLHPYRFGNKRITLRIIRKYCIKCMGGMRWVDDCVSKKCTLFDYKKGKNPKLMGQHKFNGQSAERMQKVRAFKNKRLKLVKT